MEMKDAGTQVSIAQQGHSAPTCPALNLPPSLKPVCSAMSLSQLYSLKCKLYIGIYVLAWLSLIQIIHVLFLKQFV